MRAVPLPRCVRPLLLSVALAAPFAVVTTWASSLVAPLASSTAELLLRVTEPLAAPPATPVAPPATPVAAPVTLSFEAASQATRKGAKAPSKKPAALFVGEATVLKLAQSSARPRGAFVPATEQHPAGLHLSGVAALGIGLQDGDILIEALGMTPRAPEQVIGAIIEARAKQARFLSGTVWRAGQTFRITVEQPYLREPA